MLRIENILAGLWNKSRFSSYFYQGVDIIPDNEIPTIALTVYASRLALFINTGFTATLSDDQITGLLVHEMLHVVLNHDHRGKPDANIYLQNLAQDMVINSYITENRKRFFSSRNSYSSDMDEIILPRGLPVVPQEFFNNTSNSDPVWEDVYLWLREQERDNIRRWSFSTGEDSNGIPLTSEQFAINELSESLNSLDLTYNSSPEQHLTAFKNRDALVFEKPDGDTLPSGVHVMKNKSETDPSGNRLDHIIVMAEKDDTCRDERIFGEVSALIQSLKRTDTSWQHRLRSIVDITSQSDEWEYTWHRFNKRYFSRGIYSPGRSFKDRDALTVAVDVSGSMVMKPGDIEAAFGIIEDLLGRFRVYLLCIDETVFIPEKSGGSFVRSRESSKPYEYKKGDWKYIRTGSSGTTYFEPLFTGFMKGHRELLIIITDGFIYDIDKLQKYHNTLWLISETRDESFIPPFGKAIRIESPRPKGLILRGSNR